MLLCSLAYRHATSHEEVAMLKATKLPVVWSSRATQMFLIHMATTYRQYSSNIRKLVQLSTSESVQKEGESCFTLSRFAFCVFADKWSILALKYISLQKRVEQRGMLSRRCFPVTTDCYGLGAQVRTCEAISTSPRKLNQLSLTGESRCWNLI